MLIIAYNAYNAYTLKLIYYPYKVAQLSLDNFSLIQKTAVLI